MSPKDDPLGSTACRQHDGRVDVLHNDAWVEGKLYSKSPTEPNVYTVTLKRLVYGDPSGKDTIETFRTPVSAADALRTWTGTASTEPAERQAWVKPISHAAVFARTSPTGYEMHNGKEQGYNDVEEEPGCIRRTYADDTFRLIK